MSNKPIIDAVHAIISEAELHGSKTGVDAVMFAAALQTLHMSSDEAVGTFIEARRQMSEYKKSCG